MGVRRYVRKDAHAMSNRPPQRPAPGTWGRRCAHGRVVLTCTRAWAWAWQHAFLTSAVYGRRAHVAVMQPLVLARYVTQAACTGMWHFPTSGTCYLDLYAYVPPSLLTLLACLLLPSFSQLTTLDVLPSNLGRANLDPLNLLNRARANLIPWTCYNSYAEPPVARATLPP